MKKLFFLTALLCASLMAKATDYCDAAIVSRDGHNATITMRLVGGTTYEFSITTADNITGWNKGSNFYADKDGVGGYQISQHLTQSGNTLSVQFSSDPKPRIYANALFINLEGHGEDLFTIPTDASWAACGAVKTDPNLTLNSTAESLDTDNEPTTFQISATRDGDGAISYSSSNENIASVSNTGLVTAQGRGTATITVTSAETSTYALGIQTLTVTVTGKINWDALSYLSVDGNSSAYTNLYKAYYEGTYPRVFDIRKPGGWAMTESGIYVEYPSAVFNWEKSNITKDVDCFQQGAGLAIYMSKFTNKLTDITVNVDNTDYTFTVWYKNGGDIPAALDNTEVEAKAIKVIENGQLFIIKNGVRYNALGVEVR